MVFQLDIESKELDRLENKKFKLASEQNKKIKELEEAIKEERTRIILEECSKEVGGVVNYCGEKGRKDTGLIVGINLKEESYRCVWVDGITLEMEPLHLSAMGVSNEEADKGIVYGKILYAISHLVGHSDHYYTGKVTKGQLSDFIRGLEDKYGLTYD